MPPGAALLLGLALLAPPAQALPGFDEVKRSWRASDVLLLDRHGEPVHRVRVDSRERRLDWITLEQISPAVRQALVVSEDRRFYQHSGVDWSAVAAAGWGNLWNSRTRGASTLTMQLVGLLNEDLRRGPDGRSLAQKIGQGFSAQRLEKNWSKAQILEAYLNRVGFRGEIVGLPALSATLFDKRPAGLDAREAAIAVALLRAPNAKPDQVAQRACRILRDMGRRDDCGTVAGLTTMALARQGSAYLPGEQLAPHFARKLLSRVRAEPGGRLRTTLDAGLQRFARQTLRSRLAELKRRNVEDGAILVLDNASGDILAWVGSNGEMSQAGDVDGVTALRQAGSTLKPFLYQLAIEGRWLTAASVLDDAPISLATRSGLYNPQNYARDFKGPVSARTALASSLNTPAVRVIEQVGPNRLRERLRQVGLSSLDRSGDHYGYSLALGAADVRLLELTNAYRTLANLGLAGEPHWLLTDPVARPVRRLDAASSYIIGDILSDRAARARTFGLRNAMATPFWTAVKTGTSKDMRDNWTIGYSGRYTVGVWVGNASGAPMWDVSGMHGAAPIWRTLMQYLHADRPSRRPPAPAGIEERTVRYDGGLEPERSELFLAGTARERILLASATAQPDAIVSPRDGSLYALDPDIPLDHQRLVFKASGTANNHWWLDGKRLGRGRSLSWFPWPGRHELELRSERGERLARVRFEVRGAGVKDGATRPKT